VHCQYREPHGTDGEPRESKGSLDNLIATRNVTPQDEQKCVQLDDRHHRHVFEMRCVSERMQQEEQRDRVMSLQSGRRLDYRWLVSNPKGINHDVAHHVECKCLTYIRAFGGQ